MGRERSEKEVPGMDTLTFKRYAVIEHNEDDALIELLIAAAREHLLAAGVHANESGPLYDVACCMIARDWYDMRGTQPVASALSAPVEHAIGGIILKLKLRGGVQNG